MAFFPTRRLFSQVLNRAIVYSQNGDPAKVLTSLRYPQLSNPAPHTINIQFLLAPINPADLNVVEGVYPAKPGKEATITTAGSDQKPVLIGGNEGLARVTAIGSGVDGLRLDDWVVMTKPQSGTWCTSKNVGAADVLKVPREGGLSEVHAATITVSQFHCTLWQLFNIH
jgi:trans-2-enoyl-CoA reductase